MTEAQSCEHVANSCYVVLSRPGRKPQPVDRKSSALIVTPLRTRVIYSSIILRLIRGFHAYAGEITV